MDPLTREAFLRGGDNQDERTGLPTNVIGE